MKRHLQVVGAMLVNEEGRILSTLRPLGKKLGNYWEFPGGKVEEGESKEEAIVREIWEELDCHIEVEEKIGENTLDYGDVIITLTVFRCRMKNEVRRSEEHTSELQSRQYLVCRLLLEKKKKNQITRCIR